MSSQRQAEKPSSIINLEVKRDPMSRGLCVSLDMLELPERVIVNTYVPPFVSCVYEKKRTYTKGINAVRIIRTLDGIIGSCRCSECGASIDRCDAFCRACGKELVKTIYESGGGS